MLKKFPNKENLDPMALEVGDRFWIIIKSKYPDDVFGPGEYVVQKITSGKPKKIHCVSALDLNNTGPKQVIRISESHIPEDLYSPESPVVKERKQRIREQLIKLKANGERLYWVEQYKNLLEPER